MVEDDQRMSNLLKRSLEEEGHAVDVANDGPNGLWMAKEFPYGAIVLDVMLPGFDGFELCRQLRDAAIWTPVLMLTARDEIGDRVRGLDVGSDDYLVKPFSLLELAARIRALSRRDDRARPTVISPSGTYGSTRRPNGRGEARPSSPFPRRSWPYWNLFLRHPGTVLSRTQIIDAVWDFAYQGGSNVVDQYVKYLRDKVDIPVRTRRHRDRARHGISPSGGRASVAHADSPATRPPLRDCLGGAPLSRSMAVRLRALGLAVELRSIRNLPPRRSHGSSYLNVEPNRPVDAREPTGRSTSSR